jgi:RES domain-containing protein
VRLRGTVWRHVPQGAEPLHLGWIQLARGRWNTQRPRLACLYTALTVSGALAEFRKHFVQTGLGAAPGMLRPRDLVSIEVTVEPVLNLTRASVRQAVGVDAGLLTGDEPHCLSTCRRLALTAVEEGYRAILAPSAAAPGERTLMIYPESHAGRLTLRNGPDRLPINYGSHPLLA